jgi:branched-chain amino acid transport system substrate-binding protein
VRTRQAAVLGTTLALALAVSGCGSKGTQSSSTGGGSGVLTLGASMSLTGSLAREGQLTKEGYEICRDVINAKGGVPVNGKKLKLDIKFQDDTSTPDTAAQLVDQFNDQGIKLILSSYGSANTEAQAAVVERNGQVMLDSAGSDNKIFSKGYKRTFAVLSPATEYAASIVKAIGELAKPRPKVIAFLSADDGFSKTVAEGGAAEAKKEGFTVLPTEYFPNGATDVSSALTKVKNQHPDVIIGSVHLVEGVAIIKQAKELGVTPSGGFGESVAPPTPDFAKTLGALANGVLGSSQWTPQTVGQDKYIGTAKDYAKMVQDKYKHAPDYHNAEATAACLAFALAAEKAGSTDADKVRDAVAGLNEDTFFGKIRFDSTGQNVYKPMSVIQIQQSKAVDVWPKASAVAPLVWPATGQ